MPKIVVFGIGGAGNNTVNSIIKLGRTEFTCLAANTDAQALELSKADIKIQIGSKSTKGLGAGANPQIGERAAQEDLEKIMQELHDADIVFLTAGMGGGTGSGALPVVARALKEKGTLTIAVVTKPFMFEGKRRAAVAAQSLAILESVADTLIVIPNEKLLALVDQQDSMIDSFEMINRVVANCICGISDIIMRPGHINVDFADVCTVMRNQGLAIMGSGIAAGPDRAIRAAQEAISSPLLENASLEGARGVLLNITGNSSLSLFEISSAAELVYKKAHEDATIILGSVIDENLQEEVQVTVIATGFGKRTEEQVATQSSFQSTEPRQNSYDPYARPQLKKQVIPAKTEQAPAVDLDVPTFMRKNTDYFAQE